jgi:hypothetical protein
MGGKFDGLSYWLDRHEWPARPGEPQHEWEPPRTITGKLAKRVSRLKALGNAICTAQIYPLFQGIVEIERRLSDVRSNS